MKDLHNFGTNKYKAADPLNRHKDLKYEIFVYLKLGLYVLAISVYGLIKTIVSALTPQQPKIIIDQLALVTGGANGLGRAISIQLAKQGCHVAIADADYDGAIQTRDDLRAMGVKAEAYHVDVSKFDQIKKLREDIELDMGPVEILVNNAGLLTEVSLREGTPEDIQRIIDVNLTAQFWTARVFLSRMNQRRRGHIVAISSLLGWNGSAKAICYSATKFGIRGMMDALYEELRWDYSPVNVTTVFPNFINTRKEFADKIFKAPTGQNDFFILSCNTPEEVAEKTVNGLLQNKRHVFMNVFSAWSNTLTDALPTVLQDTLRDHLKPRLS